MRPLIVIPARGGSKGVPKKNIKLIGGKPLIQWTIDVAKELFDDSIICVSTDDFEIKETVERLGLRVPFIRPPELATDSAGTYEVLLHAIEFYESNGYKPDCLVLLQPTSPFRNTTHISEALQKYAPKLDMLVSVKETKANPYYVLREEDSNGFLVKSKDSNITRRQDAPKVWEINGAIYIININTLKSKPLHEFQKVKKYVMDEISSHDIDSLVDWELAKIIIKKLILEK
jgi:N-acylneuraminate cytidylyltransferase